MSSLILRTATRFMLPLLFLFSLFLLIRGHGRPGGGFSGGLIAASAFVLYGFAFSAPAAKHVLAVQPWTLLGGGLLLSLASGCVGLLTGEPFLTGSWLKVRIPDLGFVEIGTPVLFDVGVFLVVIGTVVSITLPLIED